MSGEDQITIRHRCECGLPANHETVCRPNRLAAATKLDKTRTETESRAREERHSQRQAKFAAARRAHLDTMSLIEKIHSAVQREATMSTVAGSQIASSAPASESQRVGPPQQQSFDDDPRREEILRVLHARADRWHALIDEAEGHGVIASVVTMKGPDKDRMVISEGAGLSPLGVVDKLGSDITGGPETVRRIRERFGRCTRDGDYPQADCRCKVCRGQNAHES